MEYGLAGASAIVEDRAVAFQYFALAGQLSRNQMQLANHRLILDFCVVQRNQMLSRAQKNMCGSLWADVLKRENFGIFVNDFGWNLFRGNFAEQAVSAHQFPPAGAPSSRRTTNGVNPSRPRSCSPNWRAASSPVILPTRTR